TRARGGRGRREGRTNEGAGSIRRGASLRALLTPRASSFETTSQDAECNLQHRLRSTEETGIAPLRSSGVNFETWLKERHPEIPPRSAAAVLALAAEGATVPFIARYRKEATGGLDEVAVQAVLDAKEAWDEVVKRQAFIVGEIEAQG